MSGVSFQLRPVARVTRSPREHAFNTSGAAPALRWVSMAALALALAGCSQESARFDYTPREAHAADFRDESRILRHEDVRSWRYSARRDIGDSDRRYTEPRYRDEATGGLPPEDAGHEPTSARVDERRRDRGWGERSREPYVERPRRAGRETHEVQRGETLFSISRQYGVDVNTLARENDLSDPSIIRVGQELEIPRTGSPRRSARGERRYSHARDQRSARGELYSDPLLRDRERGRREPSRRTAERPRRERSRDESRADETREARRQARISSAPARRTEPARSAQPAKPSERPEAADPTQIAKAEVPKVRPDRAAPATSGRTQTADCRGLMKNPPARSGANFRRPAHGLIVSRFGPQSDGRRNDGINISVPHGTPVKAAENGVVVYAGDELTGLGKLVLVRHADGWVSAYGHNDRILVERCDTVRRGQEIARAGVTGHVSKPQIHFELRKNARPVDPEQHIAGTS